MTSMSGGCLCGKIRYTVSSAPVMCAVCHCRDCQRFTGSAFVSAMRVPVDAVSVQGELKTVEVAGSSGQVIRRHFCPDCGSSIFGEPYRPDMINVMAGRLDDPSVFVPTAEVFCDYAFSWLHDGSERPHLPRGFG